jgi:hypothetical protein
VGGAKTHCETKLFYFFIKQFQTFLYFISRQLTIQTKIPQHNHLPNTPGFCVSCFGCLFGNSFFDGVGLCVGSRLFGLYDGVFCFLSSVWYYKPVGVCAVFFVFLNEKLIHQKET